MEIIQTLLSDKKNRHPDGHLYEYHDVDHIPFHLKNANTGNSYVARSEWYKNKAGHPLFSLKSLKTNLRLLDDLQFTYNGFIVAGGWFTHTHDCVDIDIFIYGENHESILEEITNHLKDMTMYSRVVRNIMCY